MILKKDIEHAVVINGERLFVYKKKKYRPVKKFLDSTEALRYARDNKYSLIVSIMDKEPDFVHKRVICWLIMEEVVKKDEIKRL